MGRVVFLIIMRKIAVPFYISLSSWLTAKIPGLGRTQNSHYFVRETHIPGILMCSKEHISLANTYISLVNTYISLVNTYHWWIHIFMTPAVRSFMSRRPGKTREMPTIVTVTAWAVGTVSILTARPIMKLQNTARTVAKCAPQLAQYYKTKWINKTLAMHHNNNKRSSKAKGSCLKRPAKPSGSNGDKENDPAVTFQCV